jgi:hypothetical protein
MILMPLLPKWKERQEERRRFFCSDGCPVGQPSSGQSLSLHDLCGEVRVNLAILNLPQQQPQPLVAAH